MKRALPISALIAGAIAIVVAGCSGGGSAGGSSALPAPKATARGTGTALFTIKIPVKQTSSAKRPHYVSPNTGSVSFQEGAGSPTVVALTPGSPTCPLNGGFYTCTAQSNLGAGSNVSITVATFASSDGSGTPLSMNTVTQTITANTDNPITVTLNGVVNSVTMTPSATSLTMGTSGSITISVAALDASGATIVGPGSYVDAGNNAVAIGLANSDTTGHAALTGSLASGYTLTYDGTNILQPTLTLSATGLTSQAPKITLSNAVADGDFSVAGTSTNSIGSPWYVCGVQHLNISAPYSPSPVPSSTAQAPGVSPSPSAMPTGGSTPPAQLASSVPSGAGNTVSNGFTTYAEANYSGGGGVSTTGSPQPKAYKADVGVCQDITIPSGTPSLRVQVFEGGNDNFTNTDMNIGLYTTPAIVTTPHPDGTLIASNPLAVLVQEMNCWDSAAWDPFFLSSTILSGATGNAAGTTTAELGAGDCHRRSVAMRLRVFRTLTRTRVSAATGTHGR